MNSFDLSIINYFNSFAGTSEFLDLAVNSLANSNFLKMTLPVIVMCWAWFKVNQKQKDNQLIIISTFISAFIGLFLARALTFILPFRLRPVHETQLDFTLPIGSSIKTLDGWSSFPSDHAVLLFTLITGIFLISKKLGLLVMVYSLIVTLIPRIYLGLHYPTDIIAGIFIGIIITIIFNKKYFIEKLSKPILDFSISKPELFYPIFFLISFQTSDLFEGFRAVAYMLKEGLKIIL